MTKRKEETVIITCLYIIFLHIKFDKKRKPSKITVLMINRYRPSMSVSPGKLRAASLVKIYYLFAIMDFYQKSLRCISSIIFKKI